MLKLCAFLHSLVQILSLLQISIFLNLFDIIDPHLDLEVETGGDSSFSVL